MISLSPLLRMLPPTTRRAPLASGRVVAGDLHHECVRVCAHTHTRAVCGTHLAGKQRVKLFSLLTSRAGHSSRARVVPRSPATLRMARQTVDLWAELERTRFPCSPEQHAALAKCFAAVRAHPYTDTVRIVVIMDRALARWLSSEWADFVVVATDIARIMCNPDLLQLCASANNNPWVAECITGIAARAAALPRWKSMRAIAKAWRAIQRATETRA